MKNPVLEAIRNRRSIRKFTDQEVPKEMIKEILEAGRWAPSGRNNQPWRFIVVTDDEEKSKLSECTKFGSIIKRAKVLIVVFLDKQSVYHYVKDCQGVGACIQNMLLAIHSLGLGGVWLGEILNQAEKVCDILGVDKNRYELMAVVAIGYPAKGSSSSRKDLKELMLRDFDF